MKNESFTLKNLFYIRGDKEVCPKANLSISTYGQAIRITVFNDNKYAGGLNLSTSQGKLLKDALNMTNASANGITFSITLNSKDPNAEKFRLLRRAVMRIGKSSEQGIVTWGIKFETQDKEYVFPILSHTDQKYAFDDASWLDTPAKLSKSYTEDLIGLLGNLYMISALVKTNPDMPKSDTGQGSQAELPTDANLPF